MLGEGRQALFWNEAVDFFERYLGIGGRGDGSLEMLFLVVLGMIVLVTMSHFATAFAQKSHPAPLPPMPVPSHRPRALTGITIPDYAIRVGADPDDIAADLARQRVELRTWRDEALARLRGFLERGCATLN